MHCGPNDLVATPISPKVWLTCFVCQIEHLASQLWKQTRYRRLFTFNSLSRDTPIVAVALELVAQLPIR
jgi:hypothetical protein